MHLKVCISVFFSSPLQSLQPRLAKDRTKRVGFWMYVPNKGKG